MPQEPLKMHSVKQEEEVDLSSGDAKRKKPKRAPGVKPASTLAVMKTGLANVPSFKVSRKNDYGKKVTETVHVERVTKGALETMVSYTNNFLDSLGRRVKKHLEISKKKTVTQLILQDCLAEMHCSGVTSSTAMKGTKLPHQTRPVAVASATRAFARGCPLGKGKFQISKQARDSLSLIAQSYISGTSTAAGNVARQSKRKTVNSGDIEAVQVGRQQV